MKILLTGASGFIGSYIVKDLINHGHTLNALSRKHKYHIKGTTTFTGDITNPLSLQDAFKGVEAVIHNAAYANDYGKKEKYYQYNVLGTKHIADLCVEYDVKHLLYTSTAGIYGFPNTLTPIKESDGPTKKPLNAYGATKIESEQLLNTYTEFQTTIIRPPLVFGAGGKPTQILLNRILNGNMSYIGRGNNMISIAHPSDVAQCFRLALEKEKQGPYNVVSFYCTIQELVEYILHQLDIHPKIGHIPFSLAYLFGLLSEIFSKDEPSFTRFRAIRFGTNRIIDFKKAKKELGYTPTYDLKKTVEDMVSWYKTQYTS